MKLIAPLALTAVSAQATFDTISYRFRDSVQELASLFIQDASFASQVFSHGCWCAKLSDPSSVNLGGNAPVDDLDQICKDWARARRCSRQQGASCEFATYDSSYEVERENGNTLCPGSDVCMSETCQIDVFYINEINSWRVANPQHFTAASNPVCPPHTTNQLNNCQDFQTTVRPVTVNQGVQDALNDNGVDNSQKNIGVTLSWEGANDCDMDLWVEDPTGEETGWSNTPSLSGGKLDVDMYGEYDTNIENISWDVAITGDYKVRLHSYDSCSFDNTLTLYIFRDGSVDTYTYFMPANSDWIDGPSFFYDAQNRRVLPAYTGPKPDYNAPKKQ
jgi:hypothetical protein